MPVNPQHVATAINATRSILDSAAQIVEGVDPEIALPTETAVAVTDLLAQALSGSLTALSIAQGTPVTLAAIQKLEPNPTPLKLPTK